MLSKFVYKFAHLNTDKNRHRWGKETHYQAPHKPLLLLAILDLFAEGIIKQNLIELTNELGELFSLYWSNIVPEGRRNGNIAMPFFHMRSEGFWQLVPRPGKEIFLHSAQRIHSITVLNETCFGAKLEEDLFELMQHSTNRDVLRRVITETYFIHELREKLLNQAIINVDSYRYSEYLLSSAKEHLKVQPEKLTFTLNHAVRDQGFRRAVVRSYDHRCAQCGVRLLTADGHTVIAAAHIIPWSISRNDDPRNGLALCALCHWVFDEGLTTLTDNFTIILSPQLSVNRNIPGNLLSLNGNSIIGPEDKNLWPLLDSLRWHRKIVFRNR